MKRTVGTPVPTNNDTNIVLNNNLSPSHKKNPMLFRHRVLYFVVFCSHSLQGGNGEAYKGVAPPRPKAICPSGEDPARWRQVV